MYYLNRHDAKMSKSIIYPIMAGKDAASYVGDLAVAENRRMLVFSTHYDIRTCLLDLIASNCVDKNPAVHETEPAVQTFMDLDGPPPFNGRSHVVLNIQAPDICVLMELSILRPSMHKSHKSANLIGRQYVTRQLSNLSNLKNCRQNIFDHAATLSGNGSG
jgi:hypothetical protein